MGLLNGQLKFMSENGFEVIGISSAGKALKELSRQENVRTIEVEMTRMITPLKDLQSVWKLYRIFRKEKPLIVHTHTPKAGTVGMLAAWLAGVPYRLHTVAGMPLLMAKGRKRHLLNFVEKRTYGWATMVYPNSYGLYNIILQHKFTNQAKLKVIGKGSSNGIDTSHFDPAFISDEQKLQLRESLGIKHDDFVYVFVGRMVRDKGINELVAAFCCIHERYPNTKLLLVGNYERHLDPLKPETEREIETNSAIIAAGYQKDVRPYFAIADVFTFPSYREGFPNVLMQSCAMGIASVTTDINGCNEIVEDGYNGIIIPPQNQDKLMEKMLYLYENTEVRKKISRVSRELIVKNYERLYVQNEILNEYHSLIKKNNV
ncbi:MAG: glycosyltransferase family 4 protein [Chitinophagaceae bacterium]|nr:glycosyltransferase family 4 protein [Chitinophagaceae bacterium]